MQKKIVGYGLMNAKGEYIVFSEINYEYSFVDVTDDIGVATMFSTKEEAYDVGYGLKFGTTEHIYIKSNGAIPTDVVKIKRCIEKELGI